MIVLLMGTFAHAQSAADELFEKYSGKEGYTTVYISKYMFDLFSNIEATDPDAKEMHDVMSRLTGIKIISSEKKDESINFLKEMNKKIASGGYKELMVIKEENQDVKFLNSYWL